MYKISKLNMGNGGFNTFFNLENSNQLDEQIKNLPVKNKF